MNSGKYRVSVFGILMAGFLAVTASAVHAAPSRDEVYRSDKLKTIVYRDSTDKNVFWYLPPVKLYDDNGTVVYYKRPKGATTDYHFYVVAYMNDELVNFLAGEIPGLTERTQFKPVIVKKFGIKVSQFESTAMSDEITDYQYLNAPHLVKFSLAQADADEFEFFLKNKPGVQANVIFQFIAERQDKYLTIELSHREIYDALGIKVSGRYTFTKAQIEAAVSKYLSSKELNIKGKGDLPIPDIVSRVITECFTPVTLRGGNGYNNGYGGYNNGYGGYGGYGCAYDDYNCDGYPDGGYNNGGYNNGGYNNGGYNNGNRNNPNNGNPNGKPNTTVPPNVGGGNGGFVNNIRAEDSSSSDEDADKKNAVAKNFRLLNWATAMPSDTTGWDYPGPNDDPTNPNNPNPNPGNPGNPNPPVQNGGNGELAFEFKKELATSNQTFLYQDIRYADSTEIASVPVYLSVASGASVTNKPDVGQIAKRDFVVEYYNSAARPLKTGIIVKTNEQYTVNAVFALAAQSSYNDDVKRWYRPDLAARTVTQNLYYRIGDGPWTAVDTDKVIDGRAVVKAESIYKGELQFYLDREAIWGKMDSKFTESSMLGLVGAILTYPKTYPQFNIVVTGRRYDFK